MHDPQQNTKAVLEAFARRDFRDWQGLPTGTSLRDVSTVFDIDDDMTGAGKLGSDRRAATWVIAAAEGYENGVRIWLDEDSVLLLDGDSPVFETDLHTLLQSLGEPDAKLDSYHRTFSIPESEWVYAGRGLTLYVDSEDGTLWRVVGFVPTTLDQYKQTLRLDLQTRRLPMRDR